MWRTSGRQLARPSSGLFFPEQRSLAEEVAQQQLQQQQQYLQRRKQQDTSPRGVAVAHSPSFAAGPLPASQQGQQQAVSSSRQILPASVEELFANAAKDPARQARLHAATVPSAFLSEFVGGRLAQFAKHGINEKLVFRAMVGATRSPGYEESSRLPLVLQHLRTLAEQEVRRQGSMADAGAMPVVSQPLATPGALTWLSETGAAELGAPQDQQQHQPSYASLQPHGEGSSSENGNHVGQPGIASGSGSSSSGSIISGSGQRISIRDVLNSRGILLPQYSPGTYNHVMCPACKGGKKNEETLSVTIEPDSRTAVFNCFRTKCQSKGRLSVDRAPVDYSSDAGFPVTPVRKRKEEPPVRPNASLLEKPEGEVLDFLLSRGISRETIERNGISQQRIYVPANRREETVVAFPYFREGQVINIKYRTLDKKFWQVKGAEKVLFGLDDVADAQEVVIVEGEIDKLSLEEAGFRNVVSVPDGAPARVREGEVPPASEDTKFSYLWACRAWLDQASKIVLATDNDAPGDALAEELARRLGRERCWRVRWPFNRADHEYVAALEGVGSEGPTADAAAAGVDAVATGGDGAAAQDNGTESAEQAAGAAQPLAATHEAGAAGTQAEEGEGEGGDGSEPPLIQEAWYRKDANEVLLRDGAPMLRAFVAAAEPLPIRGLLRFHEYYEDIMKHYHLQLKDAQGVSTGWPSLDQYYKASGPTLQAVQYPGRQHEILGATGLGTWLLLVVPGELTIVTGVPNSGKSEWIDALLCNLTEAHGWTFAMCSMEKKATDHARHLVEKFVGLPFFDLPYARGVPRMSPDQLDAGLDWVDDRFHLIRYEDDNLPSIDWVLDIAKAAVYRYGIRGLVIDPYNELDHQRPSNMTETEYVSRMLGKIKRFAQTCGVHVWFVAHPRQLREWKGQPPNLYDISGSAHFVNKADNGIVVHRNRDPDAPNTFEVQILVRKVRNKAAGTLGECVLEYDRVTGRYIDPEMEQYSARTSRRVNLPQQAQRHQQQPRGQDWGPGNSGSGSGYGSNGRAVAEVGTGSGGYGGEQGGFYVSQYGTLEGVHGSNGGFE
ncbi:hypothetical protein N2152v2_004592 [Parachlorella kessleri]